MAEHRVSVLNASLRRFEDPARSSDPRIRAIVAELRSVSPAPPMRAHFRAELRSQLVAVAPRLVAEGVGVEQPLTHDAKKAASGATRELPVSASVRAGRGGAFALARPMAVAASIVAVLAMILGVAGWMSSKAVPGDTLYGLKRANENVQLALTSGDTARGKKYLEFAEERTHEVSTLLSRSSALASGGGDAAGSGINGHTAKLVDSTLDAADNDVRSASRLLGTAAVQSNSASPLDVMAKWAPAQVKRLEAITKRVPSGSPLASRAAASTQLVTEAVTRSKTLVTLLDCHCLNDAPSDSLGPLPCIVCTPSTTPSLTVGGNGGTSGSTSTDPDPQPTTGAGSTGGSTGSDTNTSSGSDTPASDPSSTGNGLHLPSIPVTIPPILPHPSPSGTQDPSPSCAINIIGICVQI
jgi:hypothetical protein